MTNIISWQNAKLNDVTEYINRGIPPIYTENTSGTVVINQKCIRNGQVNFGLVRLTNESKKHVQIDKLLQPYDILINSTGTGTVGRVGQVIDLTQRSTVDTHVTIVRPKKKVIDPIYLGYYLKIKQEELEDLASGSTNQVELSREKISNVNVILPPLKIQKKIAEIIASLDSSIQKTDHVIKKTELLKKGLMQELFTKGIGHKKFQKTTLGELPEEWRIVKLNYLCEQIVGGGTPSRKEQKYWNGSLHWATVKDLDKNIYLKTTQEKITQLGLKNSASNVIPSGNIITSTRMGIGRFYINTIDTAINQDLKGIIIKKEVDPHFLLWILLSKKDFLISKGTGTTVKGIKLEELKNIPIPLPKILEQEKIAEILSTVDQKIILNKKTKEKLIQIKKGLMQDIFSRKVAVHSYEI